MKMPIYLNIDRIKQDIRNTVNLLILYIYTAQNNIIISIIIVANKT